MGSRASETLGMPQGTASNRLRKMLLFRQLKKHSENVCVRCGKEIETVEELSVEHIKPWEGISAELFWNLDNVAFSHMKCNVPHRYPGKQPQQAPAGTSWCTYCKKFQPIQDFYSNASTWNGLQKYCKFSRPSKSLVAPSSIGKDTSFSKRRARFDSV